MDQTWRSHESGTKQAGFDEEDGAQQQQFDVVRPPAMKTLRRVRFLRSTLDKSKAWRPWVSFGTGKTYWA
eukprot:CAMPEP_0180247664 /NCGR_PEP_ID=MMETSP0987-20121128/36272_1 /TAXON_ID=697907 /ORGANISM="non described non described, Strain CCMP2293" /LENGTH=69 /DNA_ID=CAMNT_0022215649 /DNA_START=85 /DNA_END=290 /DNA_ORIENTATION=+